MSGYSSGQDVAQGRQNCTSLGSVQKETGDGDRSVFETKKNKGRGVPQDPPSSQHGPGPNPREAGGATPAQAARSAGRAWTSLPGSRALTGRNPSALLIGRAQHHPRVLCGSSSFPLAVLLRRRPVGSSHGAQPEWHDPEAPLPQGLAAARGHVVQPAGAEDPQTQGPASQGTPHRPAPRVRTHPAHRQVPHGAVSHQSAGRQRLQPGGAAGGWHPQEGGADHRDLRGSETAEQVHGVPAGQRAAAEGVPLQAAPVPTEAGSPQEGGQLGRGTQAGHAADRTGHAHTERLQERESQSHYRGGEELQGVCQSSHGPCPCPAVWHPGQKGQRSCRTGCGKEKIKRRWQLEIFAVSV